jgi:hypothetical protein
MREIRKQRPQAERTYHQKIAQGFSDFLDGKLKPQQGAAELDAEQLTLVQNEEYEESLLVTNMVNRIKARCAQPLFALEQRLALLNNGKKLSEDDNPFGPQIIAQAFREALAPCPLQLRVKTVLYTLFDQHVMHNLDSLYAALNQRLIEAGVLPNLKYSAPRNANPARPTLSSGESAEAESPAVDANTTSATPSSPGNPSNPAAASAPLDLNGPPPSDPTMLLSGLSDLLGEHRQRDLDAPLGNTRSIASFSPRNASSTYSATELLDALNRMQRQSADDLAQRLLRPQQVESLKADLQQQPKIIWLTLESMLPAPETDA